MPCQLLQLIVLFVHWPIPTHSLICTFAVNLSDMSSLPLSSPNTKPFLPCNSDSCFVTSHQDTRSTGTKSHVDAPLADNSLATSIAHALTSLMTPGSSLRTGGTLKASSPGDAPWCPFALVLAFMLDVALMLRSQPVESRSCALNVAIPPTLARCFRI